MALDTQSKRLSAIFAGSPWRAHLPMPDASLDQGDRQHLALWCSAVLFAATTTQSMSPGLMTTARRNLLHSTAPNRRLHSSARNNRLETSTEGERR